MRVMNDIMLNLILIIFPFLVYFIYLCYKNLFMEKYNKLVLDVALFSSMYLCFKYGFVEKNALVLLFCNLPILVAYLKKQPFVALSLSFCVVVYSSFFNLFNVVFMFIKFLCYFIVYLLGNRKEIKNNTFILSVVVIQGFFLSMFYFSIIEYMSIVSIFLLLFVILLFYVIPFILIYLFQLADKITNLYFTVSELEKSKQIRDSLFKITHEVKNPIAVCKGYLDMLDIYNKEQIERYIPIIKSEISRSLDIMCDFMEFSKIKVNKEIIDINLLLEDIEEELKLFIHNKRIVLNTHIMHSEVFIEGDYNRLKQVFVNLVKNSVEAIEDSGEIQISSHVLKEICYIEVVDNGVGMNDDVLNHVKDMFFTTKNRGSGLGVSLSNEIIKAHNGNIDYYSRSGIGTRVVVKIPVVML